MSVARRRLLQGLGSSALTPWVRASPSATVRVPVATEDGDLRYDYHMALLELVLQTAGLKLRLQGVPVQGQQQTADWLAQDRLDVALLPTVGVHHADLQAIRYPIRRGLLGARLLLARRELAPKLARLNSLQALKRNYRFGAGIDWHDTELLTRIGFRQTGFKGYAEMFAALGAGRVDVLSRSVSEVWGEVDHPSLVPSNVVVVPGIALSYPLDDYFHLAPARRSWLPLLTQGLQKAWQEGTFQRLYFATYGRALERAAFAGRRIFEVVGFGVEPGTPLALFDAIQLQPTKAQVKLSP